MRTTNLQGLRSGVSKHAQILTKALAEQAEDVHNEINTIIKDIQSEIDNIDAQNLSALNKHETELNNRIKRNYSGYYKSSEFVEL